MRNKIIKVPKTFRIRPERSADLEYWAVYENKTQSEIVEEMIGKYCRRRK